MAESKERRNGGAGGSGTSCASRVPAGRACPVFRSGRNIYAQVIDDAAGKTLAAASTLDRDLRGVLPSGATRAAATRVGEVVAERARARGVTEVVFDRGGYLYHGRVRALADGARAGGLRF